MEFMNQKRSRVAVFLFSVFLLISMCFSGGHADRGKVERIAALAFAELSGTAREAELYSGDSPYIEQAAEGRDPYEAEPVIRRGGQTGTGAFRGREETLRIENIAACVSCASFSVPPVHFSFSAVRGKRRSEHRYTRLFSGRCPPFFL